MPNILSRYSKEIDISKRSVEYTSEREYYEALAKKQKAEPAGDFNSPYSFKDWRDRTLSTIPAKEYEQYQLYLKKWYQSRGLSNDPIYYKHLKQDYINLIKNLQLVLKDDELNKWVTNIDFDNDLEIIEAVPFFARKLKEIAIYLLNKKDTVKKTKLKYNMVGSNNALEKIFYEYFLKAFTKRDYVLNIPDQKLYDSLPELSSIKDSFQIRIEELYDDTHYLDKDPDIPVTEYLDLNNQEIQEYFTARGISPSSIDWMFQTGHYPVLVDNPLIWSLLDVLQNYDVDNIEDLPISAFDSLDKNRLLDYYKMDLATKYLGSTQYILSGGFFRVKSDIFEYPFESGNNWFYWPSGEFFLEPPNTYYSPILLSETNIVTDGAFASPEYEEADKIFIERQGNIHAAWLYLNEITNVDATMKANILPYANYTNGKGFQFKFPFADYGLSAEDIEYTGPGINNIGSLYSVLSPSLKRSVQEAYWNFDYSASSIDTVSVHDTTLIQNNAIAAPYYNDADKIFVRKTENPDKIHDTIPNSVYTENFERAWLYDFLKTDIPLKHKENKIYWPYQIYETKEDIILTTDIDSCQPIALSSINIKEDMWGSRAGHGLFDSDIIYKLDSPEGYPIECAYLSGVDLDGWGNTTWTHGATGVIQTSFSTVCNPGQMRHFLWQDDNVNINNTTITHKQHQLDCKYHKAKHDSIFKNRHKPLEDLEENGVGNWKDCNCKSILYSPFGHPGENFDDFDRTADAVFVDTQWPSAFNLQEWRGTDGLPYNQSQDFAWYCLTGDNIEEDLGWGTGYWRSGAGTNTFTLSTGVLYNYMRSSVSRDPDEIFQESIPNLYIRHKHSDLTPTPHWMKARLLEDGTWQKTDEITDMVLNPGDSLYYDFMDTNWFCLTTEDNRFPVFTEFLSAEPDDDSISNGWTNLNFFTTGSIIEYAWPFLRSSTAPLYVRSDITSIIWSVSSANYTYTSSQLAANQIFSFIAEDLGIYTAAATAYLNDENVYVYTDIPAITATSIETLSGLGGSLESGTIYVDTINYTWNTPISAKPFWAMASDENDETTKQKGARDWGGGIRYPIDNYTPVLQPEFSEMEFELGDFIEYRHMGNVGINWIQPVKFNTDIQTKTWCDLILKPQITSPLSAYLDNLDKELVISATKTPTNIFLEQKCGETTFINYYANEAFTWTQELTDSSLGLPPTGGLWVPPETDIIIEPIQPYANLTNRHFPTVATVPYITNLFSEATVGGFFVPKNLGVGQYISKQITTDFNAVNTTNVIYRDTQNFSSDYGFTNQYQEVPVDIIDINANWMKSGVTTSARSGFVNNVKRHQTFMPYQSKFESTQQANIGIRQITDDYTPWTGETNTTWRDETNYPSDFRGQYPITEWYNQFPLMGDKIMFNWKTDVYGNNYALFKNRIPENTITENNSLSGEIWVRNALGAVGTADVLMSDIFNKSLILFDDIKSFDIIFDILIIETDTHIFVTKIQISTTGDLFCLTDDIKIITLTDKKYVGHWYHEQDQLITFAILENDTNTITPVLYIYDINSNIFRFMRFNEENLSSFSLTWQSSQYTYHHDTKTHNIVMTGDDNLGMMFILIINIHNNNSLSYLIQPVNNSSGVVEPRDLIHTNVLNDTALILTFEGRETKNIYTCLVKDL